MNCGLLEVTRRKIAAVHRHLVSRSLSGAIVLTELTALLFPFELALNNVTCVLVKLRRCTISLDYFLAA